LRLKSTMKTLNCKGHRKLSANQENSFWNCSLGSIHFSDYFRKGLLLFLIAIPLLCLLYAPNAESESAVAPEYVVKAGFLYNLTKFVQWPEGTFRTPDERIKICIIGDDPFGNALDAIEGKVSQHRKVIVKRYEDYASASGCHIAFICDSEKDNIDAVLNRYKGNPVLTVSDMEGFASKGGIISLFMKEGRVRLRVNMDAARHSNLTISSFILELAEIVKTDKN